MGLTPRDGGVNEEFQISDLKFQRLSPLVGGALGGGEMVFCRGAFANPAVGYGARHPIGARIADGSPVVGLCGVDGGTAEEPPTYLHGGSDRGGGP